MPSVKSNIFINKVNELRKKDVKNFQTNYFMNELDDELFCLENENAILCLRPEKHFYKLFYGFCNVGDFEGLLSQLPQKEIYLEVVAKGKLDIEFKDLLKKYFEYQTTYQKLYKKLDLTPETKLCTFQANSDEIYEKLYSTFNIYFEHLMDKNELRDLINKNQVITIYENNSLKSFLIYKIQGKKAYLNHIANYGNKENLINLWKTFYKELANRQIAYLDLWYDMQNKKAENMYSIEHFKPLNIFNFCYKKL